MEEDYINEKITAIYFTKWFPILAIPFLRVKNGSKEPKSLTLWDIYWVRKVKAQIYFWDTDWESAFNISRYYLAGGYNLVCIFWKNL